MSSGTRAHESAERRRTPMRSSSTSRREQQANLRSEARQKAGAEGNSPSPAKEHPQPQHHEGTTNGAGTKVTPVPTVYSTPRRREAAAAPPVGGSYFDQKKELHSYQSQVLSLQDALRNREKDHKAQLYERDEKLRACQSEIVALRTQLATEKDNHEAMRHNVNDLHKRLKFEEKKHAQEISKDLELADCRRTIAELKEQLQSSSNRHTTRRLSEDAEGLQGFGEDPHHTSSHHQDHHPNNAVTQRTMEEKLMKMLNQLELQRARIRELEVQHVEDLSTIRSLQERSAAEALPPSSSVAGSSGAVPAPALGARASVVRPSSATTRNRPVTPLSRRCVTPVERASAKPSPRRVPTAENTGTNGSTFSRQSSVGVNASSGAPRTSSATRATNRPSSTGRAETSGLSNASSRPPSITRASPSRMKEYVEKAHFLQTTKAMSCREAANREAAAEPQATTATHGTARPRLPSPFSRQPSAAKEHRTVASRPNLAPTIVVRPTLVSAMRSEVPTANTKVPTTFRPTRLVRHHAWERPEEALSGRQAF